MKKPLIAAIALAVALALAGCGDDVDSAATGSDERVAAGSTAEEPEAPEGTAPTGPGEVCDPHNLNDAICLAFYPDAGVVNMTSGPRAQEPLRSMSDAEKVALAHEACRAYEAGGSSASTTLVATTLDADAAAAQLSADFNNTSIFTVAALAYCNEFASEPADGPSFLWTVNAYRDMGEEAAIASFADGTVIQRP